MTEHLLDCMKMRTAWAPRPRARAAEDAAPGVVSEWARGRLGFVADEAQRRLLDSGARRVLLCCSRQWGKSTVTALRAVHLMLSRPEQTVIVAGPVERQSGEFLRKARAMLRRLGVAARRDGLNRQSVVVPNGSRMVAVPGEEAYIRGFSAVDFLVLDEAGKMQDELYHAVTPMLATTNGLLWVLGTPNGQAGFFFEEWSRGEGWERVQVTAPECERIGAEFLEQERLRQGEAMFRQEYLCEFLPGEGQMFSEEILDAAVETEQTVRTAERVDGYWLGLDLGLKRDPSALAVVERVTRATGEFDAVQRCHVMETFYRLRETVRFPLETPYAQLPEEMGRVIRRLPAAQPKTLMVDATGVGAPVVETLQSARLGARVQGVVITGGESVGRMSHAVTVPRRTLLEHLRAMLETGALRWKGELAGLEDLRRELLAVGRRKSSERDDMALSLALGVWGLGPKGRFPWTEGLR